jgi:hypothetical protein
MGAAQRLWQTRVGAEFSVQGIRGFVYQVYENGLDDGSVDSLRSYPRIIYSVDNPPRVPECVVADGTHCQALS